MENTVAQERMKSFVREVVQELVDDEDSVVVDGELREQGFVIDVNVAPADVGRMVGRGGSTARALRGLVSAVAGKHRLRCDLVLHDRKEKGEADGRSNS